jgi:hypothetical protein
VILLGTALATGLVGKARTGAARPLTGD